MTETAAADVAIAEMRRLLNYDEDTGLFTARVSIHKRMAGSVVGTTTWAGYKEIYLLGRRYRAHRLAFLWVHGRWPCEMIDHINGKRDDNRIANLREATHSQNLHNQGARKRNKNGLKGVTFSKQSSKWVATIMVNRKTKRLGVFDTPEAAHAAYVEAAKVLHGKFFKVA